MSFYLVYYLFLLLSLLLFILSLNFLVMDYSLIVEINLLSLNSSSIIMTMLFDWMSLLFMSFVLFISSMVIFYSFEYMKEDMNLGRFIYLVVMFVFSMMMLIISPNLISILLGWDGLGLISYCLVIYYQNIKSYNAGMLTVLMNRIGDISLLMAIAWMLNFGSWNYIFYLDIMKNDDLMKYIGYLVILAALTKSAQIPFSSWLPAAMAAPTPVSALVHSSTLVTAGVYLLIRFNFMFSELMLYMLLFISSITMFMAGLSANFEFDLKKIIALSTLSQLGFMMSILALGSYKLAFFHLLIHALFKALLFMCAGMIIHNMNNCQDIRYMGGLIIHMPLTCSFFNICNFALCGLPFLSGFYSKDLIVEFMSMNYLNIYIYMIYYISIGLTACYTFRLTYYSMVGDFNFLSLNIVSESSKIMLKGMSGLIFLVIIMGNILIWLMFNDLIFICLPIFYKLMALIFMLLGIWLGFEVSKSKLNYNLKSLKILIWSSYFALMWNMPIISTLSMNYYPLYLGELYLKLFDQGWLEFYGGKNLLKNLIYLSEFFQSLSSNHLKIYFMMMILWIIFLLINSF
uniref:NADH-ubiquinone oxidoreductase chain 5 n=1 Tax=Timarcha goettingensis TaxID=79522 RepID=A0A0S2MQ58_9CUCU|nr:NADH deshydrogenase subunit 5 [Timarcha goettingensis]